MNLTASHMPKPLQGQIVCCVRALALICMTITTVQYATYVVNMTKVGGYWEKLMAKIAVNSAAGLGVVL